MITAKLTGFKELVRDLKQLPVKIQKQVLRAAMRKSAKIVVEAAVASPAHRDITYTLDKSIKAKTVRDSPGKMGVDVIAEAYYAAFVEKGWLNVARNGKVTQTPARPFLAPSLIENQERILDYFKFELNRLVKKKLGKK